eukprot:XP_006601643.1 uncharacterized protein LOC100816378 [Glycine max]
MSKCPICVTSRFKVKDEGENSSDENSKKVPPAKVLWYSSFFRYSSFFLAASASIIFLLAPHIDLAVHTAFATRVQKVLESVHIAANKNTVPGDVSAMAPGGIRMARLRQVNCKPVAMGENYFCSSPPPPRVRTQLVHLPIQLEPKIGSSPMEVQQRKPAVAAATIQLEHKVTGLVVGETTLIGNNVSILHNVTLGGTSKASGDRHLKIGDGVLIGPGTCILGNIKIGDGAKIGACFVVLKEVPPRTTIVGNPARVVGGKDNPIKLDKMPSFTMDHTSWSDYVI